MMMMQNELVIINTEQRGADEGYLLCSHEARLLILLLLQIRGSQREIAERCKVVGQGGGAQYEWIKLNGNIKEKVLMTRLHKRKHLQSKVLNQLFSKSKSRKYEILYLAFVRPNTLKFLI